MLAKVIYLHQYKDNSLKGIYLYQCIDNQYKFAETFLPCREDFYSNLNIKGIIESYYKDAKEI